MKKLLPLTMITLAMTLSASAEEIDKPYAMRLYGLIENFEWTEDYQGRQMVNEEGTLFGLGGELDLRVARPLWLTARAELYGGEADYEGYLMSEDELTPYSSDTEYVVLRLESELGYRIAAGGGNIITPYAGLGVRSWERTLDTQFSDRYIGRYGYTEYWSTLYAIAGVQLTIPLNQRSEIYALCAAHIALENWLTVDLENVGGPDDVELDPGEKTTYRAELGYNLDPVTISIYYETMEFSQSEFDNTGEYFQPDSKAEMIGAQIGLVF